jgi:hypothetical protein
MKTLMEDFKIYMFNAISLLISFSDIEMGLKIILLVASIGYTIDKWYNIRKNKK